MPRSDNLKIASVSVVVVFVGILLSSCTPTITATRVPLSEASLSKIRTIGVVVRMEHDLSVRLARDKYTGSVVGGSQAGARTGYPGLLGIGIMVDVVGALIEQGVRSSLDRRTAASLKSAAESFDPERLMSERLRYYLQEAKVFRGVVEIRDEEQGQPDRSALDGILEVTIREWGLRRCLSPRSGELVQGMLDVHARLTLVVDGGTVWDRDEFYLDGKCYSMDEFSSCKALLKQVLTGAIDAVSGANVNEIVFP